MPYYTILYYNSKYCFSITSSNNSYYRYVWFDSIVCVCCSPARSRTRWRRNNDNNNNNKVIMIILIILIITILVIVRSTITG